MLQKAIDALQADPGFMAGVTRWEVIPARPARFADFPPGIDPRLLAALEGRGIRRLYSHQALAYERVRAGRNVVLVTPTASGKTLSYNLPVLQTLLEKPGARAVYLFPTKALSQDQQAELNEVLLGGELPLRIYTYDGDTPQSIRVSAREEGRVVITNPDMLHTGVLPNHTKWIKFFQGLEYIVLDEIHTYRGVFGSHLTNLVRRLKRVAAFYGSKPVFICCSATIGNPRELAERIIEEEVELIDGNGAPSGEKHFVLYNPPLVDAVQGIRRGVVQESQRITTRLLTAGVKTIVFTRSRVRTELIASYIRRSLANPYNENRRIKVASYRGGYLPNERREIERGLRQGEIQGVVSTNALELGIDIGGLDAAVLAGFPGSIASCWQQAGRAGRRSGVSLAILVASAAPIDQYLMHHPEYFLSRSPESARVDPDNLFILADQLKCAVFELPFGPGDVFGKAGAGAVGGPGGAAGGVPAAAGGSELQESRSDSGRHATHEEMLAFLEENGVVRRTGGRWYWADRSYPAEGISLRSAAPGNIVIVDTTRGGNRIIGEMDKPSAKELIYDEAVYIHMGDQYIVRRLDLENQRCYVEQTQVNYYTDSIVKTDIKFLQEDGRETGGGGGAAGLELVIGDILVRSQATKYKKLKFHTHENLGYGDIHLPADEMHTRSVVLLFPPGTASGSSFEALAVEEQGIVTQKLGTLVRNVAPVFLLCDPHDLGVSERLRDPHFGCPCLYVFDSYPGGTGLAEGFLRDARAILRGALELVEGCACVEGCPSCIGPTEGRLAFNPKQATIRFLSGWAGN